METIQKDTQNIYKNVDNLIILGFSRCGNTSLSKYLQCGHPEIGYNGPEEYLKNYSHCTPVFITRNPVDRIWSLYNHFLYFSKWTFEEFLDFKHPRWQGVGCNDVIEQSNYDKYIEPFKEFGVRVYRFEEMIKLPDFPKDWRGKQTKKIPLTCKVQVRSRLVDAGITY